MGSCASKSPPPSSWSWWCRKLLAARSSSSAAAAVHPWTPPAEAVAVPVPPGQRVTVRMRASEFRALAAVVRSPGDGGVARLILDGCAAGRWAWSPAPESESS